MPHVIIIFAMALTLLQGSWLWLGVLGWLLLAYTLFRHRAGRVWALFFYTAFFHASSYLANPVFSVKHFHVVLLIVLLLSWRSGEIWEIFKQAAGYRLMWLVYAVWVMALVAGIWPFSMKAVKVSFNWGFVMIYGMVLLGLLRVNAAALKTSLLYFIGGAVTECLVGYYNLATGRMLFDSNIPNNHHLSLMLCFALFYGLWLYLTEENQNRRNVYFALYLFMLVTLGLTLSRTAWISFVLNLVLFAGMTVSLPQVPRHLKLSLVLVFAVPIIMMDFCMFRPEWTERLFSISALFNGDYIRYNGDFFGRFRPSLMHEIFETSGLRLMWGRGFQHWITDIHSLYLMFLAGAGIVGCALFAVFVAMLLIGLARKVDRVMDWRGRLFYLSALCAVSCWALTSLMATLFLQAYVWLCAALALFALGKSTREESLT